MGTLTAELKLLGVNIEEALDRFFNKQELYEDMLKTLPATVKESQVLPYFEAGDMKTAEMNVHRLKGCMGNLSVMPLFNAYSDIALLMNENDLEEAKKVLLGVLPIQEKIIGCIEKYV